MKTHLFYLDDINDMKFSNRKLNNTVILAAESSPKVHRDNGIEDTSVFLYCHIDLDFLTIFRSSFLNNDIKKYLNIANEEEVLSLIDKCNIQLFSKSIPTVSIKRLFTINNCPVAICNNGMILINSSYYPKSRIRSKGQVRFMKGAGNVWNYLYSEHVPNTDDTHIMLEKKFGMIYKSTRNQFIKKFNSR